MKIRLLESVRRMCRGCAAMFPETELKHEDRWECLPCRAMSPHPMPREGEGGYDTSKVFAGYKRQKVYRDDGVRTHDDPTTVICKLGTFYAVAERMIAFESNASNAANKVVAAIPTARMVCRGSDGMCVVHIPVESFPQAAALV